MAVAQRDYYDVLGVARDADAKRIKEAFRELALKYHPDRNKAAGAEDRFKEIAEAYAVLSDPKKRAEYDARGFAGVAGFSPEDLFAGIDFGDIFGDAGFGLGFDWGPGGLFERLFRPRRAGPARGADLRVDAVLPLEVIMRGGEETIRYAHPGECARCHGSGAEPGTAPRQCRTCKGTGRRTITRGERRGEASVRFQQITACPDCGARGTIVDKPCKECDGEGWLEREQSLKVVVPPGADDGMVLRVAGHGLPGPSPGARPGDLLVVVNSAPDTRFVRDGADLWRTEMIGAVDAALGTQIKVATLDGAVEVTVPAGTQPGEVLRLRGKGLPVYGRARRGDLNLRIEVRIPEHLTATERELFERLRAAGHGGEG